MKNYANDIFLYRGFRHEWLRTVAGFRTPHRISKLYSYLDRETRNAHGQAEALWHFGQATGVDGNFMRPIGRYNTLHSNVLRAERGTTIFQWHDALEGDAFPQARSTQVQTLEIDLGKGSETQDAEIILRGIALDTLCDPKHQPEDNPCNSNGMWPYRFGIFLGDTQRTGTRLTCDVHVVIDRAWTPNRGGLPPFEEKPLNHALSFELAVHYTVLTGAKPHFRVTSLPTIQSQAPARNADPVVDTRTAQGVPGMSQASVALRGFMFSLERTHQENKYGHLGRYLGTLDFGLSNHTYDAGSGELRFGYRNQVWVPVTVFPTNVHYALHPVLLQFDDQTHVGQDENVHGWICANSTEQAPFFSRWECCGTGNFGPEQHEAVRLIRAAR